jgi:hypothetical protein
MKFTIVFLLIVPIFSLKCSNCKNFIDAKPNIFGKCNLFPKINYVQYSPGDKKRKSKKEDMYYYCSTAREYSSMCGVEGKFYQPK